MGEACLIGTGLTKRFFRKARESARDFEAVSRADITLESGQFVLLTGRSGSGKTTLLNMLAGLLEPSEGTVLFEGRDLYALSDDERSRLRSQRMGVVPQGQTPLHSLTVMQNVVLPAEMYERKDALGARDVERKAKELLESFGILGLADSYPSELSGGELRRMAIARALIAGPSVVFADEPTSDLDDENTKMVLEKLREAADAGCAVLVSTHDSAVRPYADRVLRMDAGKLSEQGANDEGKQL